MKINAKKHLFTLIFLCFTLFSLGQKKQNVYFLKDDGKLVLNKDSADFIRVIEEPDYGTVNYILKEYYTNGEKKRFGQVCEFSPNLVLEGLITEFYQNGKRKKIERYVTNHLLGSAYYFYDNGKFKELGEYLAKKSPDEIHYYDEYYKVVQYADVDGKFFLNEDGTGKVDISDSTQTLTGNFLNGFKDGEWKEFNSKDSLTYYETFEKGKFIAGKRVDSKGEIFIYDKLELIAEFKGGQKALENYLYKKLKYPYEAAKNKIQGRVFVRFNIQKDGSIADVKILRGIGGGCDEEAIRVIKEFPKWNPGIKGGRVVKMTATLPINFNIGEKSSPFPLTKPLDNYQY